MLICETIIFCVFNVVKCKKIFTHGKRILANALFLFLFKWVRLNILEI